ncbi:RcnB family protein [Sphingomonas immobilis]|uniref:RcnB family protein n=1 Tax=Sphingomonas immobilis TaxID=3063997 RepID=A0ABT9A3C2_9SPHN|nr:RcnB family protein [Sphingomonas sp. CA1-15]MDO7844347.1 RcnB family protein [Sphingomonas sp. CA1-15]
MKKFILAALATSILAGPIAAVPASAQDHRDRRDVRHSTVVRERPNGNVVVNRRTVVRNDHRNDFRRWNKGQRFDRRYAQNYREINDWRAYRGRHLYAPPRGYHWVRSGNDAVLVAVTGGLIASVLAGAFN